MKITLPDGNDVPEGAPVGLLNYRALTIFSQVDVSLGDRLVSQSSNTYPYRCIFEMIINYGKDTLQNSFSAGLFYKDTAGHMDTTDPAGANAGFTKRAAFTDGSNVVELLAPIHSDIFFQPKLLLNGVDIRIHLTRAKDAFCLISGDAIDYKLKIISASLFIKRVGPRSSFTVGYGQVSYRQGLREELFYTGRGAHLKPENLFLSTLPKSIIIAITESAAFTGVYDKNPFAFKHFNLEYLNLTSDGLHRGTRPFQLQFNLGNAVREYYQLVTATGRHLKYQPLAIDREDFLNGYTLFGYNLTPDEECSQHVSLIRSGNIRLEWF